MNEQDELASFLNAPVMSLDEMREKLRRTLAIRSRIVALEQENARLRALLRPAWLQWHGENFRLALPDSDTRYVQFTIGELRAIAALFTEEADAP